MMFDIKKTVKSQTNYVLNKQLIALLLPAQQIFFKLLFVVNDTQLKINFVSHFR